MKSMSKEWYIKIKGLQQGPFSIEDLKKHPDITPDTLVWKQGFAEWMPISKVKELQDLFKDQDKNGKGKKKEEPKELPAPITPDGLVIDMRRDPPNIILWILLALFLLLYILRFHWFS